MIKKKNKNTVEQNLSIDKIFELAFQLHNKKQFEEASIQYKKILKKSPNHFQSNFLLGTLLAQNKEYQNAKKLLGKSILINPECLEAHNNMGNVLQELGEYKEAVSCYQKVIQINPGYAEANYNLGNVLQELGEYKEAVSCYQKAIGINPDYIKAHNNMGNVLQELGEYKEAVSCYQKVIQINPGYAEANYNLGNVLQELGEYKEAVSCYQKAIGINPENLEAYNNMGNAFDKLNKNKEAVSCYQKVIQINPSYIKAYNNLGNTFQKQEHYQEAISCYKKAIKINPNYVNTLNYLGFVYCKIGKPEEAIKCFEIAIQLEPDNLNSHWLLMNTFPIIYKNVKEIDYYRKRFGNSIDTINKLLDTKSNYKKKQIIEVLESSTNFYLHYQGKDNLKLQKKYAELIEKLTKKIYPQLHKLRKQNLSSKHIKIGFISSLFKDHSVSKTHKNFILKLNHNLFKIFVYYVGDTFDLTTNIIKDYSNEFFNHSNVDQIINKISMDSLDILMYFDIGMNPKIQIISSLKLAPIQCNTWGHPITSGFKNIDYFFSSQLMEKKDSQKYYSEKLINLPNLGIDYKPVDISNIKKQYIVNKSSKAIFFNLQNLFKLLPQHDHIYMDIIKKQPHCIFWFMQGRNDSITSAFKIRISKAFQNYNISFNKYFIFHPRCTPDEFLELIAQSDIILDSLNWSGCNTSLDAINLNKPIITFPSKYMMGRHTYSFLKLMNIEETIANSKQEYVEIAVKLTKNINFKNSIIEKIKKNKKKLFNDDKPLKLFQKFLQNL